MPTLATTVLFRSEDRGGHTGEPDLELVEGDREASGARLLEVLLQVLGGAKALVGDLFQGSVRELEHLPGQQHLAQCRAVRRDLDVGPVARPEQEGRVDLVDVGDPAAVGHGEVHGLAGVLADRLEHRPGQAGHLRRCGRAARRTARTADRRCTRRCATRSTSRVRSSAASSRDVVERASPEASLSSAKVTATSASITMSQQRRGAVDRLGAALSVSGGATRALDGRGAAHA